MKAIIENNARIASLINTIVVNERIVATLDPETKYSDIDYFLHQKVTCDATIELGDEFGIELPALEWARENVGHFSDRFHRMLADEKAA